MEHRSINYPGMLSTAEKLQLCRMVSELPAGSDIVEVGTSSGWTTCMLRDHAPRHSIIHTIDVEEKIDPKVRSRCYDGVNFFNGSSLQFIRKHPEVKCDLLFVDGSHTLLWGLADLVAISELMSEGARIAFHDCNLRHSGILLLCSILKDNGTLFQCSQVDTLFCARLCKKQIVPKTELFFRHIHARSSCDHDNIADFEDRMKSLVDILKHDNSYIIGKGLRGKTIANLFSLDHNKLIDSHEALDPDAMYCICSHYELEIAEILLNNGCPPDKIFFSQELIHYGFYLDICNHNSAIFKSYFDTKAGVVSDKRIFDFLQSMSSQDVLWLLWSNTLTEL